MKTTKHLRKQIWRGRYAENGCDVSINIEDSGILNQQNQGNYVAKNVN
jgi:hypothetical protein